jgi:hypothetical protein
MHTAVNDQRTGPAHLAHPDNRGKFKPLARSIASHRDPKNGCDASIDARIQDALLALVCIDPDYGSAMDNLEVEARRHSLALLYKLIASQLGGYISPHIKRVLSGCRGEYPLRVEVVDAAQSMPQGCFTHVDSKH